MKPLSESDADAHYSVSYFLFMLTTHRHYYKIWRIDNFETEVTIVKKMNTFSPFRRIRFI